MITMAFLQKPFALRAKPILLSLILSFSTSVFTLAQDPEPVPEAETSDESAIDTQSPYRNTEERDMKLLASRLSPDAAVWLGQGDEKFLSIFEPDHTGQPYGALLIIHDEGQHANWPHNIEIIRKTMPEYGWATLTISLPKPDYLPIQARDPEKTPEPSAPKENSEATKPDDSPTDETQDLYNSDTGEVSNLNDTPANTEVSDEIEKAETPTVSAEIRAQTRITAAIKWLNEKGQFNIALLGDGIGAARASQFIAHVNEENAGTDNINIIRGMIMLSPQHTVPPGEVSLLEYFKQAPMPTLDVYFGRRPYDLEAARLRKHLARRAQFRVYQQVHLPETVAFDSINPYSNNSQNGANRLTQRIRGFLQSHARGVKVDNAHINRR